MVSVRVVKEREAAEQRKQRLELARRVSSQAGVDSARRYEEQKRRQDAQVRSALHNQWSQEHQQQRLFMQCVAAEGTIRQGEGMRSAAALSEAVHRRSQIEARAWEAEHVLERERYQLALERQQIEAEMRSERENGAVQRRLQVKAAEVNRSKQLLEQSRSHAALQLSKDSNEQLDGKKRRFASTMSISINTSVDERTRGTDAAKKHMEHREVLEQLRIEKVLQEQRKASDRAKQVVKEMKLAEEQQRLEEEQEVMLKESMAANAMRSALRPISATDFQEQEARKAQSIQRKTEAEFEKIFLHGPWSVDSIERLHQGPTESTEAFLGAASVQERSYLVVGQVQLCAYSFATMEDTIDDAANGDDHQEQHDTSFEAPNPQSPDALPAPTPKPSPSPPHPDEELYPDDEVKDGGMITNGHDAPVSVIATEGATMSSDSSLLPLRDRQNKFLQDLEALQLRLAKATTQHQRPLPLNPRTEEKDVDTSGSTNLTAEGDLSISSMSSQEMSTRVACSAESNDSSSQHDVSRRSHRGGYGLTAEQLRSSVMKLRNKQQSAR